MAITETADPGGAFKTDAHRRVMAHLPNPDDDPVSVEELVVERINKDAHVLALLGYASDVEDILADLEADGHAKRLKSGWKNTPDGFDLLTGEPDETATSDAPALVGLDPSTLSTNGDG